MADDPKLRVVSSEAEERMSIPKPEEKFSLDRFKSRAFWDAAQSPAIVKAQVDRRGRVLKLLDEMLAEQRAARTKS